LGFKEKLSKSAGREKRRKVVGRYEDWGMIDDQWVL
jgi:hypothetical protein